MKPHHAERDDYLRWTIVVFHRKSTARFFRRLWTMTWIRTVPQGQRSLSRYSSEGFDEEFVVPSAGTAFHDQAVFAWMLFQ